MVPRGGRIWRKGGRISHSDPTSLPNPTPAFRSQKSTQRKPTQRNFLTPYGDATGTTARTQNSFVWLPFVIDFFNKGGSTQRNFSPANAFQAKNRAGKPGQKSEFLCVCVLFPAFSAGCMASLGPGGNSRTLRDFQYKPGARVFHCLVLFLHKHRSVLGWGGGVGLGPSLSLYFFYLFLSLLQW